MSDTYRFSSSSTLKRCTLLALILISLCHALRHDVSKSSIKSGTKMNTRKSSISMLAPDSNPNKRVISPDDIQSLFSSSNNRIKPTTFQDNDDDEYDDSDIDDMDDIEESPSRMNIQATSESKDDFDSDNKQSKYSEISQAIQEMQMLESMAKSATPIKETSKVGASTVSDVEDKKNELNYEEFDYANLEKLLDSTTRSSVVNALSMSPTGRRMARSSDIGPRTVKYEPGSVETKDDPMRYGAYRRWKLVEKQQAPKKTKNGNAKKSGKNTSDSFYDAIKNFSSGQGMKSGVGMAEPPPNKGPITPKKAPTKKNTKRVITPDDIESLFSKDSDKSNENLDSSFSKSSVMKSSIQSSQSVSLNDEDLEEEEEEESTESFSIAKPFFDPNEEIPKWLDDAAKEQKKQRSMKKGRKPKGILQDWRFWGAVIATAAFASAFYTVSQQTGGSFPGLPLSGSGNELVI